MNAADDTLHSMPGPVAAFYARQQRDPRRFAQPLEFQFRQDYARRWLMRLRLGLAGAIAALLLIPPALGAQWNAQAFDVWTWQAVGLVLLSGLGLGLRRRLERHERKRFLARCLNGPI